MSYSGITVSKNAYEFVVRYSVGDNDYSVRFDVETGDIFELFTKVWSY